jgi:hypothetical protein
VISESGEVTFVINTDGEEPYEVTADLRDIRLWERIGPRNTLRKFAENPSADDIFSLAHITIKRQRAHDVSPLADWIDSTRIHIKQQTNTVAALDRMELAEVISKALNYPDVTPEIIADHVMDFLETLPGRQPDPTLRVPSPG